MHHTLQEPGTERARRVKLMNLCIGVQKGLLYYIFCERTLTHDQVGRPHGGELIDPHEALQSADIALLASRDRLAFVHTHSFSAARRRRSADYTIPEDYFRFTL